jgi:CRISPR-associated protein Csx17
MSGLRFDGCRAEPLGSYLQGLGWWRVVTKLADPRARARWDRGALVLETSLSEAELLSAVSERFSPLPIASPWNNGSGFANNGKAATAENVLEQVRSSADSRLALLRAVVEAADQVVADGQARGWGGKAELWNKDRKLDVVILCRNTFPDDALEWVDATVVLGQGTDGAITPTFSRLLGTGGNFGRQDVSATYLQRALAVLAEPDKSASWLRAAVLGEEDVPYLRAAVGQFDPGRAGGIQSSPREKQDDQGFANPWAFLLTIEGAMFFAGAAVRRQGALSAGASVPFLVRSSPVGYGSAAASETVHAELWAPTWRSAAGLADVEQLLREGRADWNRTPARTALDMVRALASRGVDRTATAFVRHLFVERLGQNPLAVPAGRIEVREHEAVALLAPLDRWINRLRSDTTSQAVALRLRQYDSAQFSLAASRDNGGLGLVLIALGALHAAVARSGGARAQVRAPLVIRNVSRWWAALNEGSSPEFRIAAALVSGRDVSRSAPGPSAVGTVRALLSPIAAAGNRLTWSERPTPVEANGIVAALAAAHRRRVQLATADAIRQPAEQSPPSVRGVRSAFRHSLPAPLADVVALANGDVDEQLLSDWVLGLMLLDWAGTGQDVKPDAPSSNAAAFVPPALALLLPFTSPDALRVLIAADRVPEQLVLRPGEGWHIQLHAGDVEGVCQDAARRLRISGLRALVDPDHLGTTGLDGDHVSAALLVPTTNAARLSALRRIAHLPVPTPTKPPTSSALPAQRAGDTDQPTPEGVHA